MDIPSTGVLVVNGLIAGAAVLGILSVWASRLGHVCDLHDLRADCDRLRHEYNERLAAMRRDAADEAIEVEILEVEPEGEPVRMAA